MRPPLVCALLLAACSPLPDTVGEAAPDGVVWRLVEANDRAVAYAATIQLFSTGKVTGSGPCNRFTASQSAPLPWVEIGAIAATRRACPELDAEAEYFRLLAAMDFAEVAGDGLLLTNGAGESLFFRKTP